MLKGTHTSAKRSTTGEQVIAARKQNLSIYDISRYFSKNRRLSPAAVERPGRDCILIQTGVYSLFANSEY
jgi:hypothetical protein